MHVNMQYPVVRLLKTLYIMNNLPENLIQMLFIIEGTNQRNNTFQTNNTLSYEISDSYTMQVFLVLSSIK